MRACSWRAPPARAPSRRSGPRASPPCETCTANPTACASACRAVGTGWLPRRRAARAPTPRWPAQARACSPGQSCASGCAGRAAGRRPLQSATPGREPRPGRTGTARGWRPRCAGCRRLRAGHEISFS
eukprot:scaffold5469_cov91-Isochrysis_galbana.AAC.2